ncbi:DUF2793 domain-containing protein [Paracoccus sediminis]|uniref:DUF2793 domain-containing protein n=2 Tax=Paracoccus sediminis TaxID=1214787 RepID=A0A238XJT5_9RHOB|nr:DUF2793 domain-containing protein [Paracoccus sediminis]TBN48549.1 DUF2793 domain-containing protein [Paracoccus sediminis]SNR58841.1 Protein of unknown function [Paracoccus sediminis]
MSNETMRLQLPLLQPAQAQKHVTVNEALMRLDGLANAVLESVSTPIPPAAVIDGQSWAVPQGASDSWAGQAGRIAVGANGGWIFVNPSRGMRAFVADRGAEAIFDGQAWFVGAATLGILGAGLAFGMSEAEVTVEAGTVFDTAIAIPANVMVIGAVARVTQVLTGSLQTWRFGTADSDNRFGQGLGKDIGSWARGMLGTPMTYYAGTNLLMTGEGGGFTGGRIKLAVHWMELRLPD